MKDFGSCELRPIDAMNNFVVWMIWKIFGHVSMAINSMNNSRL